MYYMFLFFFTCGDFFLNSRIKYFAEKIYKLMSKLKFSAPATHYLLFDAYRNLNFSVGARLILVATPEIRSWRRTYIVLWIMVHILFGHIISYTHCIFIMNNGSLEPTPYPIPYHPLYNYLLLLMLKMQQKRISNK